MAAPPARIDKYELIRRLGHGGMGTVYLARDPDLAMNLGSIIDALGRMGI